MKEMRGGYDMYSILSEESCTLLYILVRYKFYFTLYNGNDDAILLHVLILLDDGAVRTKPFS